MEYRLECMHNALERMKDVACKCGGPAVIEIFGEEPFAPVSKKEAAHFNDEQQKLVVHMTSVRSQYMTARTEALRLLPIRVLQSDLIIRKFLRRL